MEKTVVLLLGMDAEASPEEDRKQAAVEVCFYDEDSRCPDVGMQQGLWPCRAESVEKPAAESAQSPAAQWHHQRQGLLG